MRRPGKDRGAVLLTTLLVMTVMASLAVLVLDDIRVSVRRATNMSDYAQADWYVRASEDYASSHLVQKMAGQSEAALNAALLRPQNLSFPIKGGVISFNARDGSHCLVVSTIGEGSGPEHLRRLLEYLGWDRSEAISFVSALRDWQDVDSTTLPGGAEDFVYLGLDPAYRTPNRPIISLTELRAIVGMTEDRFQALRPFLCVGDGVAKTRFNINTAHMGHAILVAALLGDGRLLTAQKLIENRPGGGYDEESLREAASTLAPDEQKEDTTRNMDLQDFSFAPDTVWIEANIFYRKAHRAAVFEFRIDKNRVLRTYRRLSAEARRPDIADPGLETDTVLTQ
ncbi:MAG: type II secretion system minor pseudopilin GspK [Hyphomonadaceae bacterium]|nr:type II secretion system minor pseudopilin GspK [Hyphomonadaceae bacterium]MBC6412847.1 type II secretion system minor pseudopilin GspK [Hyphomonadaceae bacterium]